jgi:hypothetical protein
MIGLQFTDPLEERQRIGDMAAAHPAQLQVIRELGDIVAGRTCTHVARVALCSNSYCRYTTCARAMLG